MQQETFEWVAKLNALRRKHDALGCGAEQVLASNDDWMVTLRDAGKAAERDRVVRRVSGCW